MSFTILRTAVGSAASVFVLRALKAIPDIRIVVTDIDPLSVGFHFADSHYVVPLVSDPNFIASIEDICSREQVNCILPTLEEEILQLAIAKHRFDEAGVTIPIPNVQSIEICCDKYLTYKFLQQQKIPTPKTFLAIEVSELNEDKYIVKPRSGRGSKHVYLANNIAETTFFANYVYNPIIQEFIYGIEYSIDTLADLDGNFLYCVVRERIATESGISCKGRIVKNRELEELARKIVTNLTLIGPTCIQIIVTPDGNPFVLEINLRIGGGAALSIASGVTIINDLIDIAKGKPINPIKSPKENLLMLRYWEEVFVESLK
jgi:carbamoyl-phosphate synthase large subunit